MNFFKIFITASIVYFSILQTSAANELSSDIRTTDNLKTKPNIQVEDNIQRIKTLWTLLLEAPYQPNNITIKYKTCRPIKSEKCKIDY